MKPLRRLELTAHGLSAVDVVLTVLLVGTAWVSESNPGAAAIIDTVGLAGWGVLVPLLIGAWFAILRRLDGNAHPFAVVTVGVLAVTVAGNIYAISVVGFPETVNWAFFAPRLALAVLAATTVSTRHWWVPVVRSPTHGQRRAAAVALTVLLLAQGLGGGVALEEGTQQSMTNTLAPQDGTRFLDNENGTKAFGGTQTYHDCSVAYEGSCSTRLEYTAGGPAQGGIADTPTAPKNMTVYVRMGNFNADQTWNMVDGGNSPIFSNILTSDSFDTGTGSISANFQTGVWYEIRFDDIDQTNDTYVVSVFEAETGNQMGSTKEISADADINSNFKGFRTFVNGQWWMDDAFANYPEGQTGTLNGTVTDQSGSPVSDVTVSDGSGNSTTTDGNGDYSLSLQNDMYTLTASKRGYANESASVTIDGSDETQDFTLGPSSPPYVDAADPTGGEYLNLTDRQVNLNATVADDSGDTINATIYHNPLDGSGWTAVATENGLQSDEEINATVTASPGENWWKVETTDGVNSANSSVYSWRVGSNMVIFNGSDLTPLDTRTVSVELNSTDSDFTDARTTTDGILELTGVPREQMRATLNAPDFVPTSTIVDDPSRLQVVVLYPDDNAQMPGAGDTFTQCFSLRDLTGEFPASTSVVGAQQYLNGSFETASADFFGASNEARVTLQNETIYRLIVANEQGDTKILGQFVADDTISECIELTIESSVDTPAPNDPGDVIQGNVSNVSYVWDAYRDDPDSGSSSIKFEFDIKNDTRQTDAFRLRMYEYQNEGNVLVDTSLGVLNSVEYTETLTSAEANKTWVVAWNATLDGETVTGSRVLGAKQMPPGIPIDTKWKGWISAMGLVLVSGLFGGVRAKEGAVVIPLLAGILWYIDWLHPETGILAILGGLAIAVIIVYGTEKPTP